MKINDLNISLLKKINFLKDELQTTQCSKKKKKTERELYELIQIFYKQNELSKDKFINYAQQYL